VDLGYLPEAYPAQFSSIGAKLAPKASLYAGLGVLLIDSYKAYAPLIQQDFARQDILNGIDSHIKELNDSISSCDRRSPHIVICIIPTIAETIDEFQKSFRLCCLAAIWIGDLHVIWGNSKRPWMAGSI
jgi:hypothetical protein